MSSVPNNPWIFLGAAVVGIVTAAGVLIWERIQHAKEEQLRQAMRRDVNQQLSRLNKEIQELRAERRFVLSVKKRRNKAASIVSNSTEDFVSTKDLEEASDLEFYDCSDDESGDTMKISLEQTLIELDETLENSPELSSKVTEQLEDLCFEYPEDPELLWRLAKSYYKTSEIEPEIDTKKQLINKGIEVCNSSLSLSPSHGATHKWLAILYGARSELQSIRERITDGILFKRHLDEALRYLPDDTSLMHMLGRYCYEIAKLSWVERKVASTIAAELPVTSFEEALDYCVRAGEGARKRWKENELLAAKCLIGMGEYGKAVERLVEAERSESPSKVDTKVDSEVKSLLAKYNSYR